MTRKLTLNFSICGVRSRALTNLKIHNFGNIHKQLQVKDKWLRVLSHLKIWEKLLTIQRHFFSIIAPSSSYFKCCLFDLRETTLYRIIIFYFLFCVQLTLQFYQHILSDAKPLIITLFTIYVLNYTKKSVILHHSLLGM